MVRRFSVLPGAVILSLILLLAIVVYAINITTQPVGTVESVEGKVTSQESWYEKYKESIWVGKGSGETVTRDPLSQPFGG